MAVYRILTSTCVSSKPLFHSLKYTAKQSSRLLQHPQAVLTNVRRSCVREIHRIHSHSGGIKSQGAWITLIPKRTLAQFKRISWIGRPQLRYNSNGSGAPNTSKSAKLALPKSSDFARLLSLAKPEKWKLAGEQLVSFNTIVLWGKN